MTRTFQYTNILALVATIVVNYLSNTGIFNGNTMSSVSAKYHNLFTPAGYAFSIWGLIYLALIGFVIYQSKGIFKTKEVPKVVDKIGWMFVLSCLANCLWIIAWLYDYTGLSVLIMVLLLIALICIVFRTRMELDLLPLKKIAVECWPFAIYLGWICVALIANVAAYLTKIQWDGLGMGEVWWTIVMIVVATGINIMLIWKRNLRESAGVGAWGLAAVAIENWNEVQGYLALLAVVVILISSGIHAYRNNGKHFLVDGRAY
jgi:hypothetical protein